jgi:pimeloyl-ACP methyl ester carboxylesterase
MPTARANGIEIEYDTFGDPSDPALLLVMGFTAQLIAWDPAFCQRLVDDGFHVIRFDNRDCGLSTCLDGIEVDVVAFVEAWMAKQEEPPDVPVPYKLTDMANDAVGLLDHLGIERAHIVGASMGGMIAQAMAVEQPQRVLSMTSIMSTTGEMSVGQPTPEAMQALLTPPPSERDAFIGRAVATSQVFASRRYFDPERVARRAAAAYDRAYYPEGATRQLSGVFASGHRAEALRSVRVPTLVIHGADDTLVDPSGGARTAELIPGSRYALLADMGHDLPEPLWPFVTGLISLHARTAISS